MSKAVVIMFMALAMAVRCQGVTPSRADWLAH